MKRKIDKIKNKRLVIGGSINNLSPNEILVEQKGDTISLKERVNGEIKEVSGSGSSNEGEGSNIEYLDVSGLPAEVESVFLMFSILAKYNTDGYGTVISTPFLLQNVIIGKRFKAVIIDFTMQISEIGLIGTIKDAFIAQGFTQAEIDAIPRITKEQFYSLE